MEKCGRRAFSQLHARHFFWQQRWLGASGLPAFQCCGKSLLALTSFPLGTYAYWVTAYKLHFRYRDGTERALLEAPGFLRQRWASTVPTETMNTTVMNRLPARILPNGPLGFKQARLLLY